MKAAAPGAKDKVEVGQAKVDANGKEANGAKAAPLALKNSKEVDTGAKEAAALTAGTKSSKEDAKKQDSVIWTGHQESLKQAVALLEEFKLPTGLLPLEDVVEIGYVKATGYMWITQKKKVEHNFKLAGKLVSYATEINGYLEKRRIKKLSGVKAKELLIWAPVGDISVDDSAVVAAAKIHFKSFAGITKTFPVEAFGPGQ